MYFDDEDERDVFEVFGEAEAEDNNVARDNEDASDTVEQTTSDAAMKPTKIKTGFSWAAFAGGLMALVWIAGAIGGPLSYFGVNAVLAMDPAMQAGLIALAFGPALLFWVTASAAGEALKSRRLTMELLRASTGVYQTQAGEAHAQQISNTVKSEIETLNEAVSTALDRLSELEQTAQRNAMLFNEAVAASRENTASMSHALKFEREAMADLNGELKGQTEEMASSIGRQIRLMREASKLVKTEITAAEDALETHLSSFAEQASVMGEHTAQFHHAADSAAAATASLNGSMGEMLAGLSEATRLTETARKSTEQAVLAANETASAVRETTRNAVFEAKRAAQLIRAEAQAMQEAANETMARLQSASSVTRAGSEERVVSKKAVKQAERKPVIEERDEITTLHAAANAAVSRGSSRPRIETAEQPRRVFKGFGSWGNFMPPREEPAMVAANESAFDLADFGSQEKANPDADLKSVVLDMVTNAGVDLDDVLHAADLERIARCSRDGASARRRAVIDAAPGAVTRIVRHVRRNDDAQDVAKQFRSRPDLAKSENKGEGGDLVRAYLLIDAALV